MTLFGSSVSPKLKYLYLLVKHSARRSIWEDRKALVDNHNKKAERSFTMALNKASDWTAEEVTMSSSLIFLADPHLKVKEYYRKLAHFVYALLFW